MSGLIGALSEAWSEIRHHKLRVLLSLIGIAVSVGAITAGWRQLFYFLIRKLTHACAISVHCIRRGFRF